MSKRVNEFEKKWRTCCRPFHRRNAKVAMTVLDYWPTLISTHKWITSSLSWTMNRGLLSRTKRERRSPFTHSAYQANLIGRRIGSRWLGKLRFCSTKSIEHNFMWESLLWI